MNEPSNPFALAASEPGAVVQVAQSKEAQTIQAALVVAKRFPRDQHAAYQRIIEACKRRGLAEEASYVYTRGGTQITGPSIRLLEEVFRQWGNVQSGVVELEQLNGETKVQAFAWDLETNAYDSKTFTVTHERKSGDKFVKLTDPRDIYEHVANYAARRKRSCMEAVVPRDIIEDAVRQCDATLKSNTEPIAERIKKMVPAFAEFGVSVPMIEKRLGHKLDAAIEQQLVMLRKIYVSLKDGMSKREDWFDVATEPQRPVFDRPEKQRAEDEFVRKMDERAEADAGLAPATATPLKRPVGRPPGRPAAPRPVVETKFTEPKPAPNPAVPVPVPEPEADVATPQAGPVNYVYNLMVKDAITETEIMSILRRRGLCQPDTATLAGCTEKTLNDLIKNWDIAVQQAKIDRRGK